MKRRSIKINGEHLKDLELMLQFLKIANGGISLNSIAFRRPTHIYRSDLSPSGLGGYSNKGFMWRFYLEPKYQSHASNNLLKHIAAIITPWVDIIAG